MVDAAARATDLLGMFQTCFPPCLVFLDISAHIVDNPPYSVEKSRKVLPLPDINDNVRSQKNTNQPAIVMLSLGMVAQGNAFVDVYVYRDTWIDGG
jgi:hypothetical protein